MRLIWLGRQSFATECVSVKAEVRHKTKLESHRSRDELYSSPPTEGCQVAHLKTCPFTA